MTFYLIIANAKETPVSEPLVVLDFEIFIYKAENLFAPVFPFLG